MKETFDEVSSACTTLSYLAKENSFDLVAGLAAAAPLLGAGLLATGATPLALALPDVPDKNLFFSEP